jgi:hypothetical protein
MALTGIATYYQAEIDLTIKQKPTPSRAIGVVLPESQIDLSFLEIEWL